MNLKNLRILLLKSAIRHWKKNLKRVRKNKAPKIGSSNCNCCKVFPDNECTGCPIRDYTGEALCCDTPYIAIENTAYSLRLFEEKMIVDEIEFLKAVLSAEKKNES